MINSLISIRREIILDPHGIRSITQKGAPIAIGGIAGTSMERRMDSRLANMILPIKILIKTSGTTLTINKINRNI